MRTSVVYAIFIAVVTFMLGWSALELVAAVQPASGPVGANTVQRTVGTTALQPGAGAPALQAAVGTRALQGTR
jgi:hypothetical protein